MVKQSGSPIPYATLVWRNVDFLREALRVLLVGIDGR